MTNKTLQEQIEELEEERKEWHESYDGCLYPDGFGTLAVKRLDEALSIIKQLQEENKKVLRSHYSISCECEKLLDENKDLKETVKLLKGDNE